MQRHSLAVLAALLCAAGASCVFDSGGIPAGRPRPDARPWDLSGESRLDGQVDAFVSDGQHVDAALDGPARDGVGRELPSMDLARDQGPADASSDAPRDARDALAADGTPPDAVKPDLSRPDVVRPDTWPPDVTCHDPALTFNGGQWIEVPYHPSYDLEDSLTVSAWVKPGTVAAEQTVIAHDDLLLGAGYRLVLTAGMPEFQVYGTTGADCGCQSSTRLTSGSWYHLAGSFVGGTARVFVNGQPVACSCPDATLRRFSGPMVIGAGSASTRSSLFHGTIDGVLVTSEAWTAVFNPKDPTLTGSCGVHGALYFPFSEQAGQGAVSLCPGGIIGQLGAQPGADPADPQWSLAECVSQRLP